MNAFIRTIELILTVMGAKVAFDWIRYHEEVSGPALAGFIAGFLTLWVCVYFFNLYMENRE